MSNTNPARGMRDFLPADIRKRNYVIGIIREVYEKYGFEPLETPSIENLSTLTNKYGEEGDQLMFKILKRGEKLAKELEEGKIKNENELTDLALRYDLTVPLARVVANYKNDLPKFFKRYQIQPVWRADRPARGRYREFYQCDVDAIGSKSMLVEAELISAVCRILEELGFENFVVRINHRKLLEDILVVAGVPEDKFVDVLVALDKLDKIGKEGVTNEFIQRGVSPTVTEKLLVFFESIINSDIKNVLGKSSTQKFMNLQKQISKIQKILSEQRTGFADAFKDILKQIDIKIDSDTKELEENFSAHDGSDLGELKTKVVKATKNIDKYFLRLENNYKLQYLLNFISGNSKVKVDGFSDIFTILNLIEFSNRVVFDPNLARGLSYYTGAIFEVVLTNGDFSGSIAGGGRYDGLIGMFGKEEIPAVGFSLGLERILLIMEERGMFPDDLTTNAADVLVTIWNEESAGESLKLANELRQKDLRVLVYPQADKLGKQFKYADQINVEYVCVLGETELAENKVTLKNMKTGEQETISVAEATKKIKL